ncbi:MAG: ParB/Srx family N-terminal domain-containing protein [Nitrospirota bacterium]
MEKIKLEIPIAGVPEEVEIEEIDIDKLVLDEENPRIGYWRDNIMRVTDATSQGDLEIALKSGGYEDYNRLKRSIETSEGAMEEIWVYPIEDGRYKIIDGNTRVLIYRDLKDKYPQKDCYKQIRCKVLPPDITEKSINFIRLIAHLRGVNDWQAYERARMLYILWYHRGYTEEELQSTTKLSLNDIRRWREAYKNMNEQFLPTYSYKLDALLKFSYFVEFENRKIKDGMKRYGLTTKDFCDWVGNDEVTRAQDVRDLRKMFENDDIARILKEEGFQAAKYELSMVIPAYASRLFEHIEKCIIGLKRMSREEEQSILSGEEPVKKTKIMELYEELSKFVDMLKKYE